MPPPDASAERTSTCLLLPSLHCWEAKGMASQKGLLEKVRDPTQPRPRKAVLQAKWEGLGIALYEKVCLEMFREGYCGKETLPKGLTANYLNLGRQT